MSKEDDKLNKNEHHSSVGLAARLKALTEENAKESVQPPKKLTALKEKAASLNVQKLTTLKQDFDPKKVLPKLKDNHKTSWLFKYERQSLLAVLGLLVFGLVIGYFVSPLSQVQSYKVNGLQDITKQEVLNDAGLKPKQSVWLTVLEQHYIAKQAEKNNPQIQHLSIDLVCINRVKIDVTEHVRVGYVQSGDRYVGMLSNGFFLPNKMKNVPTDGLPIYENFKSNDDLKMTVRQFGELSPALRHSVSEIIWSPTKENSQRVILFMQDGNEVLISANQIKHKLKYYPAMAAQMNENGFIDLQVGAYATSFAN